MQPGPSNLVARHPSLALRVLLLFLPHNEGVMEFTRPLETNVTSNQGEGSRVWRTWVLHYQRLRMGMRAGIPFNVLRLTYRVLTST
ncbi:hypothetical protein BKA70DRAFT_1560999, partial [Coprinopsis sp. MPI-PUGE-AT-0042]